MILLIVYHELFTLVSQHTKLYSEGTKIRYHVSETLHNIGFFILLFHFQHNKLMIKYHYRIYSGHIKFSTENEERDVSNQIEKRRSLKTDSKKKLIRNQRELKGKRGKKHKSEKSE